MSTSPTRVATRFRFALLALLSAACGGSEAAAQATPDETGGSTGSMASGGTAAGTTGGRGTGGNTGGRVSTGGSGGAPVGPKPTDPSGPPPEPRVLPCEGLGEIGEWQNITPPGVENPTSFVVDPVNAGIVYTGSNYTGIYKTSDCGATWTHVNTGSVDENGESNSGLCGYMGNTCAEDLDGSGQWTFGIDQVYPDVLYTNSGYGASTGLLKSMNAGVDWSEIWPPDYEDPSFDGVPGFVGDVVVSPYDHSHLLVTFHDICSYTDTHPDFCLAESTDSGATWRIIDGDPAMGSAHESKLGFLQDSDTWIFIATSVWRTADRGASWTEVSDASGGGQIYRADDGVYYIMGAYGIIRSDDDGVTWTALENTGVLGQGLTGAAGMLIGSAYGCAEREPGLQPYVSSPITDGVNWSPYPFNGDIAVGAIELHYDPAHGLLYSSNCASGFWRVRLE